MMSGFMKMIRLALVVSIILLASAGPAVAQDSGLVRIQVDVDEAILTLDGSEVPLDSFGNKLLKYQWFILKLPIGEYNLKLAYREQTSFEELVTVYKDRVTNVPRFFVDTITVLPDDTLPKDIVFIHVMTDPDSASVIVDGATDTLRAPLDLELPLGTHRLTAISEGFEELSHQLDVQTTSPMTLLFNLEFQQPASITPEDLGLVKGEVIRLRQEVEATALRKKYSSLAESFLIIPLGQGLLARLVMGNDVAKESNILILSGVVLSTGSYVLGKFLHALRLRDVQSFNEAAKEQNLLIKEENKAIELLIREQNAELINQWLQKNKNRGKVDVQTK